MKFKLSRYVLISDPLDQKDDLRTERIVFSTRTGKGIKITNYVIALIREGEYTSIPDRLFTILMYHEIIVPEDEEEQDLVVQRKKLTAQDALQRQANLLIRDTATTTSEINAWTPDDLPALKNFMEQDSVVKTLQLSVAVEVKSLERGLDHFAKIRNRIRSFGMGEEVETEYRLVFINPVITGMIDFLPLDNPSFDALSFYFSAPPGKENETALLHYLSALSAAVKRLPYLQRLPLSCHFMLEGIDSSGLAASLPIFKELSLCRNLKLHIDLGSLRGCSAEKELSFMLELERAGIRAFFLPAIDDKYQLAGKQEMASSVVDLTTAYKTDVNGIGNREYGEMKVFYDDDFVQALQQDNLRCSHCVYLPLCGGRTGKKNDDSDCPAFTRNFMKKVEFMYSFSLEKPEA